MCSTAIDEARRTQGVLDRKKGKTFPASNFFHVFQLDFSSWMNCSYVSERSPSNLLSMINWWLRNVPLPVPHRAEMENLANFLIDWPSERFAHQTKLISIEFSSKLFVMPDYHPDTEQQLVSFLVFHFKKFLRLIIMCHINHWTQVERDCLRPSNFRFHPVD